MLSDEKVMAIRDTRERQLVNWQMVMSAGSSYDFPYKPADLAYELLRCREALRDALDVLEKWDAEHWWAETWIDGSDDKARACLPEHQSQEPK